MPLDLDLYPQSDPDPIQISRRAHTVHVHCWKDLIDVLSAVAGPRSGFVFRGQARSSWGLESTQDRFARQTGVKGGWVESYILNRFQRLARSYVDRPPAPEDRLGWLALLRHHGAPSRLMDWTRSPYVAVFFALQDTAEPSSNEESVVWALDAEQIGEVTDKWLRELFTVPIPANNSSSRSEAWFRYLSKGPSPEWCLLPLQPQYAFPRMVEQQGVFLAAMASVPFHKCLDLFFGKYEESGMRYPEGSELTLFRRILIAPDARKELLCELYRMNISSRTLFPGIDGLVRSLSMLASIRQGDWMGEPWLDSDL